MPNLRTGTAVLAILGGLAAISMPASDAAAAKGCRGPMQTVCGIKADGPRTYDNGCAAKSDGARVVHLGECQPVTCWSLAVTFLTAHPMCGTDPLNHQMMTYPNTCAAEHAGANWLHEGPCTGRQKS